MGALRISPMPAALPVVGLVEGKRVEEAAEVLPRLFNLCRVAQMVAARAAFGLPLDDGWQEALRREIVKEHVVKLCLKWPGMLSIPQIALPRDWADNDAALRETLFGDAGSLPTTLAEFRRFLCSDAPVARVLSALDLLFPKPVKAGLPLTTPASVFATLPQDNSVGARRADLPVIQALAATQGHGVLWRAAAVIYDLAACLNGDLPLVELAVGRAIVPAARGYYGIRCTVADGKIAAFSRITPTDHLIAKGGVLETALGQLPRDRMMLLAPTLLSILDPCFPVKLEENVSREAAYA